MSDFIVINVIDSKPVYGKQNSDSGLRELLCGVTIVDPNNNTPINISLNEESTRIMIMGGLQYLGELGDPIAIQMVSTFMACVEGPTEEEIDEPDYGEL